MSAEAPRLCEGSKVYHWPASQASHALLFDTAAVFKYNDSLIVYPQ